MKEEKKVKKKRFKSSPPCPFNRQEEFPSESLPLSGEMGGRDQLL